MVVVTNQQVNEPLVIEILDRSQGEPLPVVGYHGLLAQDFTEHEIVSGGILSPENDKSVYTYLTGIYIY